MSLGFEITEEVIARQPPEARAIIRALLAQVAALTERNAALAEQVAVLTQRVAELEERLGKSPQNSSLPPSSQHPHAKPPAEKPKSKRKRGGQPGHPRHERALIPVEECAEVVVLEPDVCRRCGQSFRGDNHRADLAPLRHQVWELPEIKPIVTEYQRHRWTCCGCGESTCAELPDGVPTSTAGPRLVALTAMLMGCFRQSKRRVATFLELVLGQPCSPGWVVKLQNQATAAMRPAYEQLAAQLPVQEQLSLDETPSKEGPTKAWMWTCVARTFTVFALHATRGACVVAEQRQRTRVAARGHLAQTQLRHAKRRRQPVRRNDPHRRRNLPPTAPQPVRIPRRNHSSPTRPPSTTNATTRGVNGYRLSVSTWYE